MSNVSKLPTAAAVLTPPAGHILHVKCEFSKVFQKFLSLWKNINFETYFFFQREKSKLLIDDRIINMPNTAHYNNISMFNIRNVRVQTLKFIF